MVFIHASVREDQNVCSVTVCTIRLYKEMVDRFFQTCILVIYNRKNYNFKAFHFHRFDLHQVGIGKDRVVDL